ncbi:MAG: ABC transporter ATP-binding protein [Vicinamibacterales bacterium]
MIAERGEPPILRVCNLTKRYPARPAPVLEGVSFCVARGELLTIVGPSGAGKTTLLNVIAQTDTADDGDVQFESETTAIRDAATLSPGLRCRIGYVTQDDHLLPWRTVLDNVLLPLQLQKRLTGATCERAHALLRTAGLADYERHFPAQLSGGLRKRVSLVRTLVYDPPVILMDEPFAAVDVHTRASLQDALLELWDVGRKTIVFVTHDIAEAIALGDRTLVLGGTPARVRSEHRISIARPRSVADLFTCPEFTRLYTCIRAHLQQ